MTETLEKKKRNKRKYIEELIDRYLPEWSDACVVEDVDGFIYLYNGQKAARKNPSSFAVQMHRHKISEEFPKKKFVAKLEELLMERKTRFLKEKTKEGSILRGVYLLNFDFTEPFAKGPKIPRQKYERLRLHVD